MHNFQGIVKKDTANEVLLSSISKSIPLQDYLSFNKDGYSAYCKKYNSYWYLVEIGEQPEGYTNFIERLKNLLDN
ncbi:hypothetical protein MTZ49_11100 [Entomomonas sp. E2T0]|uniref:hypothetical protein n=1 Tax=Entomomonas sp. E2T0 TaxID=2930213 RepID=UPI0022284343|nr:hypothetical protein [Entomomonas sp. E2T0]UYZ83145.1 hypothetical protein MTZ49_11100 [Entomomonas sp. E2T0]